MFRKNFLFIPLLLSLSLAPALTAQTVPDLPDCFLGLDEASVGTPYYCDYGTALNNLFAPFFQASTGVTLTFTFNVTAGSTLPPGMALTDSGVFSGTPTTAGSFDYSFDINFKISFSGQTITQADPFATTLVVNTGGNGATRVDPGGLVFSLNQGAAASSQIVALTSRRNSPITYTASVTASSGGNWLSVTPSGAMNPFQSSIAVATADPNGMVPGTYSGSISFALSTGENFKVPVLLTVTSSQQRIVLSQSGLFFQSVQGGSAPPSQSISVLNGGSGSINFSASAAAVSGGNWLSVSPASGAASSSAAGSISASISTAGLAPGTYYGQITVSAANIANSPQTASVVLTVSSPAQSPGPSLSSTGAILVQIGATAAAPKSITVTNPSPNALTYTSTAFSDNGKPFYTVSPANGTLTSGQPLTLNVQPAAGLAPGVYTGNLTLLFSDAITQSVFQRRVAVVMIVVSTGASARGPGLAPRAAGCSPTKLIPVMTQLGDGFKVAAAWPSPIEVTVVDDCGTFLTTGGTVITTFSTGDPPLSMASLQDGRWSGTWVPRNTSSKEVTIIAQAQQAQPALRGTAQIGGSLQTNPSVPVIDAGGVVSAASNTPRQPLAPGSYITIYGKNLNPGSFIAPSLPLQTTLGGSQAILAGKPLALNYAGSGQINALVPFDAPVNTVLQLIVQQSGQLSVPEPVVLSPAQPAIFTQDLTGTGPGVIVGFKADGSAGNFVVDRSHPVSVGDTLVIYCTGLGPVDQLLTAGSAGPSDPLARVLNQVTATVGGQTANVSYAGLAPTLTVYQVNLVIPPGVAPGTDVPVILFQSGQQSVPVTISVK